MACGPIDGNEPDGSDVLPDGGVVESNLTVEGLRVISVGPTEMTATWTVTGGEVSHSLAQCRGSDGWQHSKTRVNSPDKTVFTYTVIGLLPETSYTFDARGVDENGIEGKAAVIEFMTEEKETDFNWEYAMTVIHGRAWRVRDINGVTSWEGMFFLYDNDDRCPSGKRLDYDQEGNLWDCFYPDTMSVLREHEMFRRESFFRHCNCAATDRYGTEWGDQCREFNHPQTCADGSAEFRLEETSIRHSDGQIETITYEALSND